MDLDASHKATRASGSNLHTAGIQSHSSFERMRQPGKASKLGSPTFATNSCLAVWAQPFIAQHLGYQVTQMNATAPSAQLLWPLWPKLLYENLDWSRECHGFEFGKWHVSLFKRLNVTATVWQCFASLFEKGTVEVTSVL